MRAQLAGFAAKIGLTGLAIALLVAALAVQTVRIEGFKIWPLSVEGWKAKSQRFEAAAKSCNDRLVVSNASIDTLESDIADLNQRARERAAEFEAAKKRAARARAELAIRASASDARIARLRALAAQPGDGTCKVPAELARELEGL